MRVIIAGGGTGGHLFPGLAIAEELKKRNEMTEVIFVGTEHGIEARVVPKEGYPIKFLRAEGMMGVSLTNDAGTSIEIIQNLPELAKKKITLSYVPATQSDRDVITSYLPQSGAAYDLSSLPASLPAYLINVKAELRIEGAVVATGPATGLGKPDTLSITVTDPGQNTDSVSRTITAGEYVVINPDFGGVSLSRLQSLETKLADTRPKLLSGASGLTREDVLGDLLQAAALVYSAEQDLKRGVLV